MFSKHRRKQIKNFEEFARRGCWSDKLDSSCSCVSNKHSFPFNTYDCWLREQGSKEPSFGIPLPDPANSVISLCTPSSDKTQITREPRSVNTTSPSFITPILWTVWQSGELFFAIMTPSEVVRFSSFIPPSLLESEMYKSVPVKGSP